MLQFSLSELTQLSKIITAERGIADKYKKCSADSSDPQLRELYQRCASIHQNHCTLLENLLSS